MESSEGIVSQRPGQKYFVPRFEVKYLDVVVQDDGLLLDEGELGYLELHLCHVVRVAPHLERERSRSRSRSRSCISELQINGVFVERERERERER